MKNDISATLNFFVFVPLIIRISGNFSTAVTNVCEHKMGTMLHISKEQRKSVSFCIAISCDYAQGFKDELCFEDEIGALLV